MRKTTLILLLIAALALVWWQQDVLDLTNLMAWVEQAGVLAPLVFIVIYAVATVLMVPGLILTIAGGALFGPWLGTLLNVLGATVGAGMAFLLARYVTQDWVEQKAQGWLKRVKQGVEEEGWRFVAFTRLVPLFPFVLLNYALGLTRIPLSHYLVASFICMLPGGFAYTWLGHAGQGAVSGAEDIVQQSLIALALLAVVAFLPGLIKRMRGKAKLDRVH
jgi:uncharacterized membrane protein YdjX (TVP38/TMEM64 family)